MTTKCSKCGHIWGDRNKDVIGFCVVNGCSMCDIKENLKFIKMFEGIATKDMFENSRRFIEGKRKAEKESLKVKMEFKNEVWCI